jgi:hypothetical protein
MDEPTKLLGFPIISRGLVGRLWRQRLLYLSSEDALHCLFPHNFVSTTFFVELRPVLEESLSISSFDCA